MSRRLTIIVLVVLFATTLFADVPRTISYQGRLTDNGVPISGVKSVTFKIYGGGGSPIWNSGAVNVTFADGLFTVELGQAPQPSLPTEIWPADTALSLGVAIAPNPEMSPRLRFKTVPYALHALTAVSAVSGGGWLHQNGFLRLEEPKDSIGIGTVTPLAKVGVSTIGKQIALRLESHSDSVFTPALDVYSENTTGAIFRTGLSGWYPVLPRPAIYGSSSGSPNTCAAWFEGYSPNYAAMLVQGHTSAGSISTWNGYGYGLDAWYGKGIRAVADSATAIRAESYTSDGVATVLSSAYTGSYTADHVAVSGYSRPVDYYGIGGQFEGGYVGADAKVYATADHQYYGLRASAGGGTGMCFGAYGTASGGGINYGVFGTANSGISNWAGFFSGDVNVTGNLVNPKSTLSIDHPADPENKFLEQADIVSDNQSAIYSGNVTLGAGGSAVVRLPDWLESFCGDFRYQLTCIGGYAPVFVSSEISGNQFSISGGSPGLKVSWQITGIRKDKYAQAHPLEVEKLKAASEQGKYLHPDLYGYGADRGLSPNPDLTKGKDDAIRAATASLKKPSTPPEQPKLIKQ